MGYKDRIKKTTVKRGGGGGGGGGIVLSFFLHFVQHYSVEIIRDSSS